MMAIGIKVKRSKKKLGKIDRVPLLPENVALNLTWTHFKGCM
jgi:hypothetical protein